MPLIMTLGVAFLSIFKTIEPVAEDPTPRALEHFSYELLDQVQRQYVDGNGRVDYKGLKAAPGTLEAYYRLMAAYSPDSHPELFSTERDRLTYWINAYNAATLTAALVEYPITSVNDVKVSRLLFFMPSTSGFFYFRKLIFGGESYNLYNLENEVIRGRFSEPRIHFAINCASNGCPRLPQHAFTSDDLEKQLETEAFKFINEPRNLQIDHDQQVMHVSSILVWYEEDFLAWYRGKYPEENASLVNYLRLYLDPQRVIELDRAAGYEVRAIPYDWGLNDQALASPGL